MHIILNSLYAYVFYIIINDTICKLCICNMYLFISSLTYMCIYMFLHISNKKMVKDLKHDLQKNKYFP